MYVLCVLSVHVVCKQVCVLSVDALCAVRVFSFLVFCLQACVSVLPLLASVCARTSGNGKIYGVKKAAHRLFITYIHYFSPQFILHSIISSIHFNLSPCTYSDSIMSLQHCLLIFFYTLHRRCLTPISIVSEFRMQPRFDGLSRSQRFERCKFLEHLQVLSIEEIKSTWSWSCWSWKCGLAYNWMARRMDCLEIT